MRKIKSDRHEKLLRLDESLYKKMKKAAGLLTLNETQFIIKAIEEKIERTYR